MAPSAQLSAPTSIPGLRPQMATWTGKTTKEAQKRSYTALVDVYDTDIRVGTGYVAYHQVIDRLIPHLQAALNLHLQQEQHACKRRLRILDAGCGTGLSGAYMLSAYPKLLRNHAALVGVDYCEAMLARAAETRAYTHLGLADLDEPFDLPGGLGKCEREQQGFELGDEGEDDGLCDAVVAAGVFFENHVDPAAMPNMLDHLSPGGVAVFSVREATFAKLQAQYEAAVARGGCRVVCREVGPYRVEDKIHGVYLTVVKE